MFGLVNIFARPFGGYMSDKFYNKFNLIGRYWCLLIQTFLMGVFLCIFTTIKGDNIVSPIVFLLLWAIFTSMTEGGVFAIVPSIEQYAVGGVSGIVGAGGNLGALIGMSLMFFGFRIGFLILGIKTLISCFVLIYLLIIKKNLFLLSSNILINDRELTQMSAAYIPTNLNNNRENNANIYNTSYFLNDANTITV